MLQCNNAACNHWWLGRGLNAESRQMTSPDLQTLSGFPLLYHWNPGRTCNIQKEAVTRCTQTNQSSINICLFVDCIRQPFSSVMTGGQIRHRAHTGKKNKGSQSLDSTHNKYGSTCCKRAHQGTSLRPNASLPTCIPQNTCLHHPKHPAS